MDEEEEEEEKASEKGDERRAKGENMGIRKYIFSRRNQIMMTITIY